MKDFPPGNPIVPSSSALAMYARQFEPIQWSTAFHATVVRQYRELKNVWQFDPRPDAEWDSAEPFTTTPIGFGRRKLKPRVAFKGNCNDFAPALKWALIVADLPADCLRLATCEIVTKRTGERQGHMVLAVLTTEGALICCNIVGCYALMSPEWDNSTVRYDWREMEGPGCSGWVSIATQTLEEVADSALRDMIG